MPPPDADAAATNAQTRVFISYARADRAAVMPLAAALTAQGYDVWWDALIDGGASFSRSIETALDTADAVIVVWSPASTESDWVRDEAGHGRDRRRLVPVTLDGTEPPLGFRQYHTIDLSRWSRRGDAADFAAVPRAIAAVRGAPSARLAATAQPGLVSRRGVLIASGGVAALAAGGSAVLLYRRSPAEARNGVAVLPFKNLSADPAQRYFSDGLAEEVRAALAANTALLVAAPTSSNEFRDHDGDVRAIGSALGVAHLLEGSVRKDGNVVRVVSSLIDATTGFTTWTQTFDRQLVDVFAVQSEIARTVEQALSARVATKGLRPGGSTDVAAFELYLQGRALYDSDAGEAADRAALAKFDAAIAADPNYAAAHAARSRSLASIASQYGTGNALRQQYEAAATAARQAILLAPTFASGHAALGFALFTGLIDIAGARAAYDRAAEYGAGEADILLLVAFYAAKTGRADQAITAVRRARTLDPLNPRAFRAEASVLVSARRFRDAITPAERALTMSAKLANTHALIGTARYALGDIAAADAAFALEPVGSFSLAGRAICAQKLGKVADAQALLAKLVADYGDGAAYQQAQVLARTGRTDAAVQALSRALATSDAGIVNVLGDVMLDPIRSDVRFKRLIAQLGFA